MTDLPFKFPVIGIEPDRGPRPWGGGEQIHGFRDAKEFNVAHADAVERGAHIGMLLTDAAQNAWIIRKVKVLPVEGSFWNRFWKSLSSFRQIDAELERVEPLPFDELKERLCRSIDDNPDYWRDDETIAGETGPPIEEADYFEQLKFKVRTAVSITEIVEQLELQGPMD